MKNMFHLTTFKYVASYLLSKLSKTYITLRNCFVAKNICEGGVLTNDMGSISSPVNQDGKYGNNLHCFITIEAPVNKVVYVLKLVCLMIPLALLPWQLTSSSGDKSDIPATVVRILRGKYTTA